MCKKKKLLWYLASLEHLHLVHNNCDVTAAVSSHLHLSNVSRQPEPPNKGSTLTLPSCQPKPLHWCCFPCSACENPSVFSSQRKEQVWLSNFFFHHLLRNSGHRLYGRLLRLPEWCTAAAGILKCQRSKTQFREVQCGIYSGLKSCFVA